MVSFYFHYTSSYSHLLFWELIKHKHTAERYTKQTYRLWDYLLTSKNIFLKISRYFGHSYSRNVTYQNDSLTPGRHLELQSITSWLTIGSEMPVIHIQNQVDIFYGCSSKLPIQDKAINRNRWNKDWPHHPKPLHLNRTCWYQQWDSRMTSDQTLNSIQAMKCTFDRLQPGSTWGSTESSSSVSQLPRGSLFM